MTCGGRKRQPLRRNFFLVRSSAISVASSNVSPARLGASTKRRNSRDLLQRYFFPRHSISFNPLVDQFATEVKTAAAGGACRVRQSSVTIGCLVGSQRSPCVGTGKPD